MAGGTMSSSSGSAHQQVSTPASLTTYFTFKDYLSVDEAATFFDWDHERQVAKVDEYLGFVADQPAAAHFTSSSRASTSWAERWQPRDSSDANGGVVAELLDELLHGRTKSGFGAFGSEPGFLPQRELSMAVAGSVKQIGHEYIVERTKKGENRPAVLNSRSFYLNWCHAEKQKLMDIRLKLNRELGCSTEQRRLYWERVVVIVDRGMCADCIEYVRCLASYEQSDIRVRDPSTLRVFPPSKAIEVVAIDLSTIE